MCFLHLLILLYCFSDNNFELDFVEVLRAFLILLNRQGPTLWKGEGEDYALVVFATIKDNVTFAETLRTLNQEHGLWLVRWVEAYVKALDPSALHTVIPLIMQFLCEELQHERYDRIRATALSVAAKVSRSKSSYEHCHDASSRSFRLYWPPKRAGNYRISKLYGKRSISTQMLS